MEGPLTIDILGTNYVIELKQNVEVNGQQGAFGATSLSREVIEICSEISEEQQDRTLAHEVGHAILAENGMRNLLPNLGTEEAICELCASVYMVMKRYKQRGHENE